MPFGNENINNALQIRSSGIAKGGPSVGGLSGSGQY